MPEFELETTDDLLSKAGVDSAATIQGRVRILIAERDEARAALAEERAKRDGKVLSYMAQRDQAEAALRQLKEDLKAMGRLQKLACDLVLGDADPEDTEGG